MMMCKEGKTNGKRWISGNSSWKKTEAGNKKNNYNPIRLNRESEWQMFKWLGMGHGKNSERKTLGILQIKEEKIMIKDEQI